MNRLAAAPQRSRWRSLIGWALSAAILVAALVRVPFADVAEGFSGVGGGPLWAAAAAYLASMALRVARWAWIFPAGSGVRARDTASPLLVGMALNAVFPGKAGEVARLAMAVRRLDVGTPAVVTTMVLERLFDALTMLLFLLVALAVAAADLQGAAAATIQGVPLGDLVARIAVVVACLIVGMLAVLFRPTRDLLRPGEGAAGWLAKALRRLVAALDESARGVAAMAAPRRVFAVGVSGVAAWCLMVAGNGLVAWAMPAIELTPPQLLAMTSISLLAAALPSAPGAWGVFEAGAVLGLELTDAAATPAIALAFALLAHAVQYAAVVLAGAGAAAIRRSAARG